MPRGEPRHVSFSGKARDLAVQNSENARDIAEALGERVTGRLVTVRRYAARGDTAARLYLTPRRGVRPSAVLLVRAYLSGDAGANIAVSPALNFYHDEKGIGVYEPGGLVPNTQYDLTFLILE